MVLVTFIAGQSGIGVQFCMTKLVRLKQRCYFSSNQTHLRFWGCPSLFRLSKTTVYLYILLVSNLLEYTIRTIMHGRSYEIQISRLFKSLLWAPCFIIFIFASEDVCQNHFCALQTLKFNIVGWFADWNFTSIQDAYSRKGWHEQHPSPTPPMTWSVCELIQVSYFKSGMMVIHSFVLQAFQMSQHCAIYPNCQFIVTTGSIFTIQTSLVDLKSQNYCYIVLFAVISRTTMATELTKSPTNSE